MVKITPLYFVTKRQIPLSGKLIYNMSEISNVNSQISQVAYQRLGKTPEGRVIVGVKNDKGGYDKVTVPEENVDKFEKFLDKTNNFISLGNKFENKQKLKHTFYGINIIGAIVGGALTAALMKSSSNVKKILGVALGSMAGIVVAGCSVIAGLMVKTQGYFSSAGEIQKLDIQKYKDPQDVTTQKQ